jgi:putative SOS response-associated peptidase YedK
VIDDKLFAMAGLYDRWKDPQGLEVLSFTIITTAANELMASIHDRMPVILSREDEEVWLAPGELDGGERERLFRPYPAERMEAFSVSKLVNDLSNDSPDLARPIHQYEGTKWF